MPSGLKRIKHLQWCLKKGLSVESKKILLVSCLRPVRTRESELVTAGFSLRKNNIHTLNGGLPITIKIGIMRSSNHLNHTHYRGFLSFN